MVGRTDSQREECVPLLDKCVSLYSIHRLGGERIKNFAWSFQVAQYK